MKKIITIFALIFIQFSTIAKPESVENTAETNKKRWSLHLTTGIRMLTDLNAGPVIGLSLHSPNKRWVLGFRNDFLFTIGKPIYLLDTTADNSQTIFSFESSITEQKFSIIKFISYRYFEVDFSPFKIRNRNFYTGAALGFVNARDGSDLNFYFYPDQGNVIKYTRYVADKKYFSASFSAKYNFDWLLAEIRYDIPFGSYGSGIKEKRSERNSNFNAVSLALMYRFKPKSSQAEQRIKKEKS